MDQSKETQLSNKSGKKTERAIRHGENNLNQPDSQLADNLLRLSHFFHTLIPPRSPEEELSLRQVEAIELIAANPNIGISGLAECLQLANSTVSELVNRLVQQGYLLRELNPDNRREIFLTLAPKGNQYIEHRGIVVERNLENMLSHFPKQRRLKFLSILSDLLDLIELAEEETPDDS